MAGIHLAIVLDRPEADYATGDSITGVVEVTVHEPMRANPLLIGLSWGPTPSDDTFAGAGLTTLVGLAEQKQTLFTGRWQPGTHRYPFSLTAPAGPFSYHGRLVQVHWRLHARAWVQQGHLPATSVTVTITPDQTPRRWYFGPGYRPPDDRGRLGRRYLPTWLSTAIFAVTFVSFVIWSGFGMTPRYLDLAPFVFFVGPIIFALLLDSPRHLLARLALGRVTVRLSSRTPGRGATIHCTVRRRSLLPVRPRRITATLIGREVAGGTSAPGGSGATTNVFHRDEQAVRPPATDDSDAAGVLIADLAVPDDAPITYAGVNAEVSWSVMVTLRLNRLVAWSRTFPVTVQPAAGSLAPEAPPARRLTSILAE